MRDGVYVFGSGEAVEVAFLSSEQIVAYGGIPQAQKALGVQNLAHPEVYYAQTCGLYPWFYETGHA